MSQKTRTPPSTKTKSPSKIRYVWVVISQLKEDDEVRSVIGVWTSQVRAEEGMKYLKGSNTLLFAVPLVGLQSKKVLDYLLGCICVRRWTKKTMVRYFDIQAGVLMSIERSLRISTSVPVKGPEGIILDYFLPKISSIDTEWA